ncbi:MAG: TonB-dependent siderophore receptor [Pirellulaceae bacterium]|nr:TonB-dependent siderophore receptor [Pirellulaceae bacterium]
MSHARFPGCWLLSILVCLLCGPVVLGQDASSTQPSAQPPVLPETEVEATPPAVAAGPRPELPATPDFGRGILDGTIFDAPPVQGYRADSSTSGSIIAVPEADLPATVNVIPRDVLNDQIVLRLDDLVRNAGGVTRAGDGLFGDRIFLRGLEVGSRDFRKDGFLDPTFVPRDFQNVERVEILKGPASMLYGAGDPAGMVNLITKRPVRERFAEFGFTFGAWERARFTLDANGHTPSGKLLYRINVAQEDADSFVDFDDLSRTQVAPVVTWLIGDDTSLTWNGEWHRHRTLGFQGTPAVNGDPLFLPPNRFIGEPANDFLNTEEFRQSLVLRHQLSDDWWVSVGGYSLFYDFPNSTTSAAAQVNPDPPLFVRSRSDVPFEDEQSHSAIANLAGEFCGAGMLHKVLAGLEYNYFDSSSRFESAVITDPFDVSNPVYLDPAATPVFAADFPVFRQQRFGGYLQDLVEVAPRWKLLGGVRFDTVDFNFERNIGFGEVETQQGFDRVSPRGGVIFQPLGDETLAAYYSYARSFSPPGGGIYLNGDLSPILGESHEAGVKALLLENLSLTAAGFHTTRQNDAFNVQSIVLVQVGEVRSQGAELNLVGELTDRWSVIANYTYTDARLSDPDPRFDGRRARNVPFNTANFWTRYDILSDDCRTLGAALGLVYLGERPSDLENDLFLPGFSRWDAGVYYRRGQWNASVYLENLFDVQYAASSINELQIFQGAPFNVRATVSYLY